MQSSRLAICITLALGAAHTQAQEAGSIDLGGFELIPAVTTTLAYDDNVTRSNADDIDSFKTIIAPEVILLNNFGANQLQFGYRISRGDYFSSKEDNYTDHFLSASLDMELNSKNRFESAVLFEDGHDDRGTVFSIGEGGALDSPDKFKQKEFDFVYTYGALTANARLDLILNLQDLDYDSNVVDIDETDAVELVDVYRFRDRSRNRIGGAFYYRVASATDFVVDVSHTNIDYDVDADPLLPLDSSEQAILVGVKWESTAATTGYAKVGYQSKEFDVEAREDFSGVKWQAGLTWAPYERTSFNLNTNGDTRETNGEGNFIRRKDVSLTWQHEWLDRFSTEAGITYGNDTYDAETNVREDDISEFSVAAVYQFRRWMTIRAGYQFEKRDSNREVIDYDRNLFSITARITL